MKGKKSITISKASQKILDCKPSKTSIDERSQFYNRSIKSWLQDHDKEMYSTHNEGKSVVAERFTRILKNKIYKYVTSVSKTFILLN